MSQFDPNAWENTNVDEGTNSTPPEPATYEVLLHDARAFTSQKDEDWVVLELRVATGHLAGYEWSELRSFRDEKAFRATKATCSRLGMSIEGITSLAEFDARLKTLIGNWYTVDVKQNGDYRNTYFNGSVSPQSDVPAGVSDFAPAAVASTAPIRDEDIPF